MYSIWCTVPFRCNDNGMKYVSTFEFSLKLYKVGNVGNKCLRKEEEKNKNSEKCYVQWRLNLWPLVIHSDTYLTQLIWKVSIEGYLTTLFLLHELTFQLISVLRGILPQSGRHESGTQESYAESPLEIIFSSLKSLYCQRC